MYFTQYAVLDDGYTTTVGPNNVLGPNMVGTLRDGYTISGSFVSRPIDLKNIEKFGALCAFLTGSTLAGTLTLQVCDDDDGPDNMAAPDARYASWLTLAGNTWNTQIVDSVSVVSGAVVVPFEYALPGHRWIRFKFDYSSGTGKVRFAYTIKS